MENFVCGLLSFVVLGVAGVIVVRSTRSHGGTVPDQVKLFLCSYSIRFALSMVLYTTSLQDSILGESDHIGWFRGVLFVREVDDAPEGPFALPRIVIASSFGGTNAGYGMILGLYFYFTRLGSQLSAATVVGCCGALTAVFAYRLARLNFSEWVAWRAGWWVCLFPGMIIWSSQTSKEGSLSCWRFSRSIAVSNSASTGRRSVIFYYAGPAYSCCFPFGSTPRISV